jgi:CPA1 family monovalent cation:H+ antiporter
MTPFTILALLLTLAALASYVNVRFIGLQTTVGLMLLTLLLSLGISAGGHFSAPLKHGVEHLLKEANLGETLMGGMLSFLLFAGALRIEFKELRAQQWRVATLAFGSTLISVFLVAGLAWLAFRWLGLDVPMLYCLIFGSLISPTDPVAVIGLLKGAKAPASLETKIAGESLFNDGVGLAGFTLFVESLHDTGPAMDVDWGHAAVLLVQEAGGGILLGWVLGWIAIQLIRGIDNYPAEVLLTLALVTGGYALALAIHTSGPLTAATAGLIIGNLGRKKMMSEKTRASLDTFWELLDEVLNAMLFVLVGLEITAVHFRLDYAKAAALIIAAVLAARLVSVGIPAALLHLIHRDTQRHGLILLTWGGLRGGVSVALALSLPAGRERDIILTVTYATVAFSILVQGTTMPWLLRRTLGQNPQETA